MSGISSITNAQFLLNLYESSILKDTKRMVIELAKTDLKGIGCLLVEKYPEEFI